MIEIPTRQAFQAHAADRAASRATGGCGSRGAALRLWVLVSAQALIDGTVRGPDDVIGIEDDRRRLAARRES
jgi:hypothetical protein